MGNKAKKEFKGNKRNYGNSKLQSETRINYDKHYHGRIFLLMENVT